MRTSLNVPNRCAKLISLQQRIKPEKTETKVKLERDLNLSTISVHCFAN